MAQAGPTYLNVDTSAADLIGQAVATDTAWIFTSGGVYQRGTYDFPTRAGYFIASDAPGAPGPNTPVSPLYKNYGNSMMVFCLDLNWFVDGGAQQGLPNYWEAKALPASNYNPPDQTGNPTWVADGIYRAAYLYNKYVADVKTAAGGTDDAKATFGAALQFAIWEALYEERVQNDYSLTGGNAGDFYVTTSDNQTQDQKNRTLAAIALANEWLAASQSALNNITGNAHPYDWVYWDPMDYSANDPTGNPWMHDFGRQALIGQAVPEPAEIALIAAALAGLVAGYRRLTKSA